MTQQPTDPFATSERRPSVSFKGAPVGTRYVLEVTDSPNVVQARNFDTKELEFWNDGNPKMTVATNVVDKATGELKTLWAPKPSAMFKAIAAAQQKAGALITAGGTLVVTFTHEVPNTEKPHLNPAKQYDVVYTPPNAFHEAPPTAPPVPAQPVIPQVQTGPPATWATPPTTVAVQHPQVAPQAAAAPAGPTPEAIAALQAAGIDPATVYPGWQSAS